MNNRKLLIAEIEHLERALREVKGQLSAITIYSLKDLHEHICKFHPEIYNHQFEDSTDLPTYSIETLRDEGSKLLDYVESDDNYVPGYYGCGLLSRCLKAAQDMRCVIDPEFFTEWYGWDVPENRSRMGRKPSLDCYRLARQRWY